MSDAMSAERLDEIRAKLRDEQTFDWDYPFDDAADDLLTEVDRLTVELAAARAAWEEWKASSRAGHAHASDMAAENVRLRKGIEALVDDPAAHETYEGGAHACVDADDLNALLNSPTEGETDDRR